jgi:hypothetical protein
MFMEHINTHTMSIVENLFPKGTKIIWVIGKAIKIVDHYARDET